LRILKSESAVAAQPGSIAPAERQVALDGVKDAPTGPPTAQPPVPEQLPATISYLVGRAGHLAHLDTLLPDQEDAAPTAVVISAITGAAGTGKTALAVHWARRVADRFPDGQLWVNLRGFDPSGVPLWPADAIRGFLHALGTAPHRVPADLDAQVGLYRTRLAGKRALVILDNARDADQVRPLLPGAGGCMVVVTSRDQLAGLVAHDGAHLLNVDVLTRDEAVRLLTIRLGPQRAAAEPETVQSIAERCAMHPLALNVIAARAMTRPAFPLAAIAAELHEAQRRLDTLSGADPLTDVRAAFAMSYRTLSSEAACVFRLLGLHPGPDTSVAAAASLVGMPVARVRASLAKLAGIHLIVEHQPGRYSFHDLLRAYAAELAATHDSGDDRRAAIRRMLDHYLHSARATVYELYPQRDHPMSLMEPAAGVVPERLGDGGAPPLDWFATELAVMQAGLRLAVQTGLDRHVCQLAWTLGGYLARSGRWLDWVATQHASLEAAERLGDQVEQARAHRSLARAYRQLGRFDDAHVHLREALDLCGMVGDQHGLGRTHALLGQLFEAQDDLHTALDHAQQAIQRFRSAGDPAGQALALNSAGWSHARLADYEQALTLCAEALSLQQTTGDRYGEATTWDSLGYAYHHLGDFQQAIVCYKSSLTLRHEGGERYGEATTLIRLGDTHLVLGDTRAAGDAWRKAGGILDELEHLDAQRAHTRLQQLEAVRPPRHDQQHARSGR
jgi:tetratricopeptide (TPR) repeat protein